MLHRALRLTVRSAGVAVLLAGPLAACAGSADVTAATPAEAAGSDVPAECIDSFPFAVEKADLADLRGVPAGWPEPPVASTLCETGSTLDDTVEVASYATDADATAVLDAYESTLAGYDVVREDQGAGEKIVATHGTSTVEITVPSTGTFSVFFTGA